MWAKIPKFNKNRKALILRKNFKNYNSINFFPTGYVEKILIIQSGKEFKINIIWKARAHKIYELNHKFSAGYLTFYKNV